MPLSYQESQALVGELFTAHTQQGPVVLTLTEAVERPRRGLPAEFRTPLSLIFTTAAAWLLEQGTYAIEHPRMGMRHWMMVPVLPPHSAQAPSGEEPGAIALRYYQVLFA